MAGTQKCKGRQGGKGVWGGGGGKAGRGRGAQMLGKGGVVGRGGEGQVGGKKGMPSKQNATQASFLLLLLLEEAKVR